MKTETYQVLAKKQCEALKESFDKRDFDKVLTILDRMEETVLLYLGDKNEC